MNKFINLLLGFFAFPTMAVAIYVGFDLPLTFINTTGSEMPFRKEIFLTLGLILMIINLRRSIRRWMGMNIVSKKDKFKWSSAVSAERIKRINVYQFIEGLVMFTFGYALYKVTPEAWLAALAFVVAAADNLIFSIYGTSQKKFGVGLSSKALIVADRDVIIIYLKGLRKVSQHQQSIYFDFIKDLQYSFPLDCIPTEKQQDFFTALEETVDKDKVFFSKKMGPNA